MMMENANVHEEINRELDPVKYDLWRMENRMKRMEAELGRTQEALRQLIQIVVEQKSGESGEKE